MQCQLYSFELVPLRGGSEFGTRPQNKILVPFRGVLEILRRAALSLLWAVPPGIFPPYEQRLLLSFAFVSRRKEANDRTALLMAGWDLSIPWGGGRGDTPGNSWKGFGARFSKS